MIDRTRDGSSRRASGTASDGSEGDDSVPDDPAKNPLLEAVGAFAREEEAEIETYAANTSHAISDVARELAVQKILALQARERAAGPASEAQVIPGPRAVDFPGIAPAPGPRRSRFALVMGGGLVAAALALAVWMRPASQESDLPAYSIAARGGVKEARGGGAADSDAPRTIAEAQRLSPDAQLVVVVRPEAAVAGSVGARAFVVQGADTTEVAPNAEVAPTGAIELRFHGADLIGSRHGAASLRVIVGRPDALRTVGPGPGSGEAPPKDARWRVLTVPLELGRP